MISRNNIAMFTSSFVPPLPTLLVIPSGVGCEIGGFAGDAIPAARLLAAASGCLITHPNVMNGASLYWNDSRIHYVEGYSLDKFAAGEITLQPVRQQNIGVIFDAGLDMDLRLKHLQVVDSCRASLGLKIGHIISTDLPLDIQLKRSDSGLSWGSLQEPESLLRAGDKLKHLGATAIAVVTRFPDSNDTQVLEKYREGEGVDLLAGAEAVISHLLVRTLQLPCAHSPGLTSLPTKSNLDPRAAAEEIGSTFLPCALVGLSRAPNLMADLGQPFTQTTNECQSKLDVGQLGAIIAPATALGGEAVLSCLERKIPLITVANNSQINVTKDDLRLSSSSLEIYEASNYLEAAAFIMMLREGISTDSCTRPFPSISFQGEM